MAKVTKSGQISIPKELREGYGIDEAEYMAIEPLGSGLFMRKIEPVADRIFEYFKKETKRKGITRKDMEKALKKAREEVFEEMYGP